MQALAEADFLAAGSPVEAAAGAAAGDGNGTLALTFLLPILRGQLGESLKSPLNRIIAPEYTI